jgi:hypothetical protein
MHWTYIWGYTLCDARWILVSGCWHVTNDPSMDMQYALQIDQA